MLSKSSPVSLCSLWVFPGWFFLAAVSQPGLASSGTSADFAKRKFVFVSLTLVMKKEPDVFKLR